MPTRVKKRAAGGAPAASARVAAASYVATRGPVAAHSSVSSPPDVDCNRLPPGLGLDRPKLSEIANMTKASSVIDAAVGGLLSLGGGSAPMADAQDWRSLQKRLWCT